MNTIQHDTRSLRHIAIQRYLRTCRRIEQQHRLEIRRILLAVGLGLAVVCLAILITHHRS